ncbi:MAG: hypothetical protein IME98_01770 [Proteobacteria bacterium]|nr:hypothetical protein [Pseudomonadota bacterium]
MKRSSMIWIALIVILAYIGYVVVPMYYRNQMMVLEVKGQIKVAHMYDEYELLTHLVEKVEEWHLPIDEDDITVDLRDNDIIISMSYHVDKLFLTKYKHRFYFNIRESGDIKREEY